MQLFQQTQLATQKAYIRALHELDSMQASIAAQEKLIERINDLPHLAAEADFSDFIAGMPAIKVHISNPTQIEQVADLIHLYGWLRPVPQAETEPNSASQYWLAFSNTVDLLEGTTKTRVMRYPFGIQFVLAASTCEAKP